MLDGALQRVEVGDNLLRPVLTVLCRRDELQSRLFRLAVLDLVGHGDKQTRVGGALSGNTHGGGDVCARLDVLAGDGGDGKVDGRVWPCAVALLAVEVLDEGGEGVEVAAGRVPADEDLAGVCAQVQGEHLLLVVHVDLDLLLRLGVGDGIAVADLNLGAVFAAGAEQGADDALLVGGAAKGVVEDGEDGLFTHTRSERGTQGWQRSQCLAHLGLDGHVQRGRRGLGADGGWAKRAGEVEERVVGGHGGRGCGRGCGRGRGRRGLRVEGEAVGCRGRRRLSWWWGSWRLILFWHNSWRGGSLARTI